MNKKICPTCNGTGRIEVEKMNIEAIKTILRKGIKHWTHHAQRHIDKKVVVKECLKNVMMYSDKALEELEKEEPELPKPPKLRVKNKSFYYFNDGTERIVPIGAFPRQLLHVMKGYQPDMERSPDWFIAKAKSSGINKIRLDVVDDYNLTYDFAKDMESNNIIVEYTMAPDYEDGEGQHGDYREHIRRLKPLNNTIAEVWNEFCRARFIQADIDKALEIANYALAEGMLTSGGSWGNSSAGEKMSEAFRRKFRGQIFTRHRPYPPLTVLQEKIRDDKSRGFVLSWNEILVKPYPTGIEDSETEIRKYVEGVVNIGGVAVNLYLNCEKYFDLMGNLCKEYN